MHNGLLLGVAAAFAVVSGANDGAALVTSGLRIPGFAPVKAISLVAIALILTPMVMGTKVATTLAGQLVAFEGTRGAVALVVAVVTAVVVVGLCSRFGLPTSLTLALIGGVTGAGFGAGLPVSWAMIGFVLLLGALAPLLGGVGGYVLSGIPGRLPSDRALSRTIRTLHGVGFCLQCVAYGLNDGQKMLAVFAVLAGTASLAAGPDPVHLGIIGGCFVVGALGGLHRISGTLVRRATSARPSHVVAAELSSASTVLATGVLGVPVSMTQAISGALVGSGLTRGQRGVRWRVVIRLATAWVLTLPIAAATAASTALLVQIVRQEL